MTCNRRADSWGAKGLERAAPLLALLGLATNGALPSTPDGVAPGRSGSPWGKMSALEPNPEGCKWERRAENKLGQIGGYHFPLLTSPFSSLPFPSCTG